ncbi:MAG: N-acetyltransferase, partial [Pseudomonadota bacterium]|nr:N-acetyltransferase [Pseudomonadota bacterium]
MSDYSIRLARAGDAAYLPAIERAAATLFADDPAADQMDFNEVWTEDGHRKLIAKGHCLVAEIGETIVGFLASQ